MANPIGWCDETINPVIGCSKVSPGCKNCYAERMAARLALMPQTAERYAGITDRGKWTGETEFVESELAKPLSWKKPRRIFVGSMTDIFHESVLDEWIDAVFGLMSLCGQHTFMILTKRPERMKEWVTTHNVGVCQIGLLCETDIDVSSKTETGRLRKHDDSAVNDWPLPNVWLGVTAENQEEADKRIPLLLQTPAAKRFVSVEPMLGEIDLAKYLPSQNRVQSTIFSAEKNGTVPILLDWVICGGESGPGARPVHPGWVRGLRDQCQGAGVPFFFKSWGEFSPFTYNGVKRVGKAKAGHLPDGVEWRQFPC